MVDTKRVKLSPDQRVIVEPSKMASPAPVHSESGGAQRRAIARGTPTSRRKSTKDFSKSPKAPRDVPPPTDQTQVADPQRGNYYSVTVNKVFLAHNELFRPGIKYRVSPDIYNGTLEDEPYKGTAFKELCQTAEMVQ